MENKKQTAARLERFFAGKGFYIVLFLCVAVIGVSAWSLLSGPGKTPETSAADMAVMERVEEAVPAAAAEPVTLPEGPLTETVTIPEAPVPAVTETVIPAEAPAPVPAAVPAAERDYFIWPVGGTVDQPYSMDALTFNTTLRDWRTHDGVDIAAELGTQVKACANGTVAELRQDDLFGTTLILSHRDGLVSVYANLAELPVVSVGDRVSVGQVIGAVGDTALAEAGQVCHLHFAMALDGESVDPGDYLP